MKTYNVYGLSDWPENFEERFLIFKEKSFESESQARQAARLAYSEDLEIDVEEVTQ